MPPARPLKILPPEAVFWNIPAVPKALSAIPSTPIPLVALVIPITPVGWLGELRASPIEPSMPNPLGELTAEKTPMLAEFENVVNAVPVRYFRSFLNNSRPLPHFIDF